MYFDMTNATCRDDIKPMSGRVGGMMIFLRPGSALAAKSIRAREFTILHSVINNIMGFPLFRILLLVFCGGFMVDYSAIFGPSVSPHGLSISCFALCGLLVLFIASLAIRFVPIFSAAILIKFQQGFNLLALRALLRYDCLKHGFFLYKKLCFEPLQTRYLCGFLYYTSALKGCN